MIRKTRNKKVTVVSTASDGKLMISSGGLLPDLRAISRLTMSSAAQHTTQYAGIAVALYYAATGNWLGVISTFVGW
jgi:hypothetical protein